MQWAAGAWLIFFCVRTYLPLGLSGIAALGRYLLAAAFANVLFLAWAAPPAARANFYTLLQVFAQETGFSPVTYAWVLQDLAKGVEESMRKFPAQPVSPAVTVRVAGSLSEGHLAYLDQLVASAIDCALWPVLDLTHLEKLDRVALMYLVSGEGRDFGIAACPGFIREWMSHESARRAA